MLYAGIAWGAGGYEIEVVGADGATAAPRARFGADRVADMAGHLRGLGPELTTVVESTNGILDGRLMAAGLTVFRADPHSCRRDRGSGRCRPPRSPGPPPAPRPPWRV